MSAAAFANVARVVERVDLVSESEIAAAMRRMRDHLGMVVEGSAATTIVSERSCTRPRIRRNEART